MCIRDRVYFGWITVATIANATVLLVSTGWNGFGLPEATWTIVILAVGALIGVATLLRFQDIAYGLVLIWAYAGILIKHTSASGFSNQYPGVIVAVNICLALFIAAVVLVLSRKPRLYAKSISVSYTHLDVYKRQHTACKEQSVDACKEICRGLPVERILFLQIIRRVSKWTIKKGFC